MSKSYHNKSLNKPSKVFKKHAKAKRKAKEREAIEKGDFDDIPKFRKSDQYDWL